MTTTTKMTTREKLVRRVALRRGVTMAQVTEEMGYAAMSTLYSALQTDRPQAPTLERIRTWIVKYGGRSMKKITNDDLIN